MTPNQQVLSDEQIIDLAVKHNLGRKLRPLGPHDTGSVFYTDASYRTSELFQFADAIESATLAALAQQAQPVAWQCRFKENAEWSECSKEHHDWVKRCPHEFVGYEARDLYTSPPAPQATKGGGA